MSVTLLDKWQMVQAALADPAVTPSGVCVLAVSLEFRNHETGRCFPAYESIAARVGLSRRMVITIVADLTKASWLQTVKGGGRSNTNAVVFNFGKVTPASPFEGETVKPDAPFASETVNSVSPFTNAEPDNGCHPVHETVTPMSPEPYQYPERDIEGDTRASAPVGASRFAEFMAIYPKKVGEKNARFHWDRIIAAGEATADDVLAGAARYAENRHGEDFQYTAAPANWLRDARWKDDLTPKNQGAAPGRPSSRNGRRGDRMTAGEAMMDVADTNIRG